MSAHQLHNQCLPRGVHPHCVSTSSTHTPTFNQARQEYSHVPPSSGTFLCGFVHTWHVNACNRRAWEAWQDRKCYSLTLKKKKKEHEEVPDFPGRVSSVDVANWQTSWKTSMGIKTHRNHQVYVAVCPESMCSSYFKSVKVLSDVLITI